MAPSSDNIRDGLQMLNFDVKMENFKVTSKMDKFDIKLEDFEMSASGENWFEVNSPPKRSVWRNGEEEIHELMYSFREKLCVKDSAVETDIGDIKFDPATIDDLSDVKFDFDSFMDQFPSSDSSWILDSTNHCNLEKLENKEAVRYDCMLSAVAPKASSTIPGPEPYISTSKSIPEAIFTNSKPIPTAPQHMFTTSKSMPTTPEYIFTTPTSTKNITSPSRKRERRATVG